jgi:hypothetical protein
MKTKGYFDYEDIKHTTFKRYYPSLFRLYLGSYIVYISQTIRRLYTHLALRLNNYAEYQVWTLCSHHKGWIDEGLFITCRRCGAKK